MHPSSARVPQRACSIARGPAGTLYAAVEGNGVFVVHPLGEETFTAISLYYNDHPPPHFHVRYGEAKAIIDIETLTILYGELTPRVLGLVVEWVALHKTELLTDWVLARNQEPLMPIAPLE